MLRLILDSDTVSELLKNRNPNVQQHAQAYKQAFRQLTFTSATVLEILYGLERVGASAQIQRAEALFAANDELIPTSEDYRLAATIAGAMSKQGTPIGLVDPLIAACAIRHGYGVASGNIAHYEFIQKAGYSFHLENWRDA